jgi:uncharacterized protein YcbX
MSDAAVPDAGPIGAVTALATTPVKGLRLLARKEVMLTRLGVSDNRCFFLIDERARMVNGKRIGILSAVRADYDDAHQRLELRFPDGGAVADEARGGNVIEARFFSLPTIVRLVRGPFSEALSSYTGQQLRLVRADPRLSAIDRGPRGAVSLISEASVQRLSAVAGEAVDPRRFRMLIEAAGFAAHGEDALVGRRVQIGDATVAIHGHVGRCLVTTQHPETGEVDLPTLDLLDYRRGLASTEPLAFGVYGEVLVPGAVRLGDAILAHPVASLA